MFSKFLLALTLLAAPLLAAANISIQGSRVIYDQRRSEIDVLLRQVGKLPGLVQIWLDEGDAALDMQEVNPAFTLAPGIARMEPGGRQIVRIVRSGDELPDDRESLLWLNVQETPLHATGTPPDVRTRIKFFYRPRGLPSPPENAHEALQFSLAAPPADGAVKLRVYNPTPYHITFRELALQSALKEDALKDDVLKDADSRTLAEFGTDASGERMVAPMDELVLTLARSKDASMPLPAEALVKFSIINDQGGQTPGQQHLPQALHTEVAKAN